MGRNFKQEEQERFSIIKKFEGDHSKKSKNYERFGYFLEGRKREKRGERLEISRTPGMAPPGTDFIIVYMPSPPELDESGLMTIENKNNHTSTSVNQCSLMCCFFSCCLEAIPPSFRKGRRVLTLWARHDGCAGTWWPSRAGWTLFENGRTTRNRYREYRRERNTQRGQNK